jgi:thiamine biosynthesis lipoprotein
MRMIMIENHLFSLSSHTETIKLMGNQFEFVACHQEEAVCHAAILAGIDEVKRIEALLTTFSDTSYTAKMNQNAGIKPVEVPQEIIQIIERSKKISQLTDGAFDITYGGIDMNFWNFNSAMGNLA